MSDDSLPNPHRQRSRWLEALRAARAVLAGEEPQPASLIAEGLAPQVRDASPVLAFIAALDMPLALLDAGQRILAVSRGARALLPALAPGRAVSLAVRDPDALGAIAAALATGKPGRVDIVEHGEIGRTLRFVLSPLKLTPEAGPALAIAIEDLSAMKTSERMRVDFVANASHELRTPLATLLGFIETLQGPARQDIAARDRFLGIMAEQARRMSRLIDDLLSLSRIEQHAHLAPREPVNLVAIAREIIDSLSVVAAERHVVVSGPQQSDSVMVSGDRDELLRLAENLVENAIKYGQGGGKVEVVVRAEGDSAILSVRDYGPGIPPEHIPRLTERFYRVDVGASREAGGTGLGLAIVKHIVLRHRGRLVVESALGAGSTFLVHLPLRHEGQI